MTDRDASQRQQGDGTPEREPIVGQPLPLAPKHQGGQWRGPAQPENAQHSGEDGDRRGPTVETPPEPVDRQRGNQSIDPPEKERLGIEVTQEVAPTVVRNERIRDSSPRPQPEWEDDDRAGQRAANRGEDQPTKSERERSRARAGEDRCRCRKQRGHQEERGGVVRREDGPAEAHHQPELDRATTFHETSELGNKEERQCQSDDGGQLTVGVGRQGEPRHERSDQCGGGGRRGGDKHLGEAPDGDREKDQRRQQQESERHVVPEGHAEQREQLVDKRRV